MASRVYLVQIRYGDNSPPNRIAQSTREIQDALGRMSVAGIKTAWTSPCGKMFGIFVRSEWDARAIYSELNAPKMSTSSPMRSDDNVLILEIGNDLGGNGFSACWSYLQHR